VVILKISAGFVADSHILSVGEISWLSGINTHFDGLATAELVVAGLDTGLR
jgi:hypothetical protein